MSDRAERAALEATQAELKSVRARLAAPPDREAISAALDRLAQEAHGLTPQLDEVRADLAAALGWLDRQQRQRNPNRVERPWQRILWWCFLLTGVLSGLMLQLAPVEGSPAVGVTMVALVVGLVGWELAEAWRRR